jgi:hypothetical protein
MIQIKDLPLTQELDMSAVRGGMSPLSFAMSTLSFGDPATLATADASTQNSNGHVSLSSISITKQLDKGSF